MAVLFEKKRGTDMYSLTVSNVQSAPSLYIKIQIFLTLFYFAKILGTKHIFFLIFSFFVFIVFIQALLSLNMSAYYVIAYRHINHLHCVMKTKRQLILFSVYRYWQMLVM